MPRKPVTISLPEDLTRRTGRYCRAHSLTLSEVAREALGDYLFRQEMAAARRRFTARLQRQGVLSEKELLKKLSK